MEEKTVSAQGAALPCPACGKSLAPGDGAVTLHGDTYHADCALYQPRRGN